MGFHVVLVVYFANANELVRLHVEITLVSRL